MNGERSRKCQPVTVRKYAHRTHLLKSKESEINKQYLEGMESAEEIKKMLRGKVQNFPSKTTIHEKIAMSKSMPNVASLAYPGSHPRGHDVHRSISGYVSSQEHLPDHRPAGFCRPDRTRLVGLGACSDPASSGRANCFVAAPRSPNGHNGRGQHQQGPYFHPNQEVAINNGLLSGGRLVAAASPSHLVPPHAQMRRFSDSALNTVGMDLSDCPNKARSTSGPASGPVQNSMHSTMNSTGNNDGLLSPPSMGAWHPTFDQGVFMLGSASAPSSPLHYHRDGGCFGASPVGSVTEIPRSSAETSPSAQQERPRLYPFASAPDGHFIMESGKNFREYRIPAEEYNDRVSPGVQGPPGMWTPAEVSGQSMSMSSTFEPVHFPANCISPTNHSPAASIASSAGGSPTSPKPSQDLPKLLQGILASLSSSPTSECGGISPANYGCQPANFQQHTHAQPCGVPITLVTAPDQTETVLMFSHGGNSAATSRSPAAKPSNSRGGSTYVDEEYMEDIISVLSREAGPE